MKQTLLLPFYFLLICSCTQSQVTNNADSSHPTAGQTNDQSGKKGQPQDVLKLTKREVIDKQGTGLVASTFLLPADWTVQDQLYWDYNDATQPIRVKASMKSGDGSMAIQIFPNVRAVYSTGPAGASGYPPPKDIITGMKELIRQERPGINYKFVSEKVLQNTNQQTQYGMQYNQAGVIRIEYTENGKTQSEDFFATLEIVDVVTPSMMGNMESIVWAAAGLYACKASAEKLPECEKIAQTINSSAAFTKPFYNRYLQVVQLLSDQVYASIYQAGQISKIISQTNDQMIANIDASYRQSQAANDRVNDQFSDYIRGVDRYENGGDEVQLPSGYSNAWVNDKGEYLLSSSPGYNPSDDFYGNWKELRKN